MAKFGLAVGRTVMTCGAETVLDMSGEALMAISPELLHPQLVELCLMYNRLESIEHLEAVPRLQAKNMFSLVCPSRLRSNAPSGEFCARVDCVCRS